VNHVMDIRDFLWMDQRYTLATIWLAMYREYKKSKLIKEDAGFTPCICGAIDDQHVGECHFGWHNLKSCPDLAYSLNIIYKHMLGDNYLVDEDLKS
jgi:hypothetical protein